MINNLIDQIDFLKNKLHSKDTIIKQIIENSKYNNKYFQNKNNNDSYQIKKFVSAKKTAKHKTSDNNGLNNIVSLENKIEEKENQMRKRKI